jgi:hypothetical protein
LFLHFFFLPRHTIEIWIIISFLFTSFFMGNFSSTMSLFEQTTKKKTSWVCGKILIENKEMAAKNRENHHVLQPKLCWTFAYWFKNTQKLYFSFYYLSQFHFSVIYETETLDNSQARMKRKLNKTHKSDKCAGKLNRESETKALPLVALEVSGRRLKMKRTRGTY